MALSACAPATLLSDEPDLEALTAGAGSVAEHPGMWCTIAHVGDDDAVIDIRRKDEDVPWGEVRRRERGVFEFASRSALEDSEKIDRTL